ncbi:MAG: amidohydrolase family protein [Actinomycetota bacterium]|nr:amidohydrolase family protein [Actinomycetota bacterium]
MNRTRTLLRGGHVLSMDPAIGVLRPGDVLIDGDRIAAVAPRLDVDADVVDVTGQIVMPGMIDTHRHTWQTQLRGIAGDWTLTDYLFGIRFGISPHYTAEDVHLGNKLGALDGLAGGVTTILDFSHCINTPDHADAAVAGLRSAGGRAVFGYGFFDSSPGAPAHFTDHARRLADFERIAATHFPSDDALVTLGASLNEYGLVPLSQTRAEIEAARDHGALVVAHLGATWSVPSGFGAVAAAELFGPDQVQVHCNTLSDSEFGVLADLGVKVSISPETELNMGMGRPVFAQCERHGIKPTLSCDVISLNSGDLITQMRLGLGFKRWADTEAVNLGGSDPAVLSTTALQAIEWCTINAAEAIGRSATLGSITPGKQADLVVIGGDSVRQRPVLDPAATVVFHTTPEDIVAVYVAGRCVKSGGTMLGHDMAKLAGEAQESASGILARVADSIPQLPGTPQVGFAALTGLLEANLALS